MNVLLVGSGAREHALAWKMRQSPQLDNLFIAPGNAGTAQMGTNVAFGANDFVNLGAFALRERVEMVVVGPEDPLVNGIADYFATNPDLKHIAVIGPSKKGAQLEGSKDFAKDFMKRHGIPTAAYRSFGVGEEKEAQAFLKTLKPPYVVKADGLAAGKGVVIVPTLKEAAAELDAMFAGKFGEAGKRVVIEEFLDGIELSVFVLTDGKDYVILPEAKDYKRVGEGNTGLNTGGMGAVSPIPFADKAFMEKVESRIIRKTIEGLRAERIPYKGFIFFGLINVGGEPMVIEYNVRMGDPETEVVMMRIMSDFMELLKAVAVGKLGKTPIQCSTDYATTVMLTSGGYPGAYQKGKQITGIHNVSDSVLFHAGTSLRARRLLTSGGRVIAVSATGPTMESALAKCNADAAKVQFEGKYYRSDIGFDLRR